VAYAADDQCQYLCKESSFTFRANISDFATKFPGNPDNASHTDLMREFCKLVISDDNNDVTAAARKESS
jgi:hypothetical protein